MLIRMRNPIKALKKFIEDSKRVMKVAQKPSKEEYIRTLKITSVGVGIAGMLSFAIFVVFEIIRRYVFGI